jgi:hypothetical protein
VLQIEGLALNQPRTLANFSVITLTASQLDLRQRPGLSDDTFRGEIMISTNTTPSTISQRSV